MYFINLPKLYTFPEYSDIINIAQKDIINKTQTKVNKKKLILPILKEQSIQKVLEEYENPFE